MSNPYFNKIVKGVAEGMENFKFKKEATKISNEGFQRTDNKAITGQMYEIILERK
ncbi:hypothetical protein ACJD0Z_04290 [Flavobacteriaceae bacterium M23B6Z8]